ncbi:tetratricopeptide repeat protein [Candidatus Cloacimonadota bacterium]
MLKKIVLLLILIIVSVLNSQSTEEVDKLTPEQIEIENLFNKGIEYLQNENYEKSKETFSECLTKEVDDVMRENVFYYLGLIENTQNNPQKSNEYFVPIISNDEFNPVYSFAFDFVMQNYNQLNQSEEAEKVKKQLYQLYNDNKIPDRKDSYFCFNKFSYNGKIIYAEESFSTLDTPVTEGSFSKNILYVYDDKDYLQYTIETVKIHKTDKENPRYVLTQRFIENQQVVESNSFWQFTYDNPIDIQQLLTDSKSIIDEEAESQSFFKVQAEDEKQPEEFKSDELKILDAIKFVKSNPLSTDVDEKLNYIFKMANSLQNVKIEINTKYIGPLNDDKEYQYNRLLIAVYFYSILEYMLENNIEDSSDINCTIFALESFIKVYEEIININPSAKSKVVNKLIKKIKKKGVENYVKNKK